MSDDIYRPAAPFFGVVVALLCCWVLCRMFGAPRSSDRNLAVDGLRGYLALLVFFCHASVWYVYVRTGAWTMPANGFFKQLGLASVSLFFMVTAYLFYSRVLRDKAIGRTNWCRLFVSRIFRLWPLYLVMLACIVLTVGCVSGWSLHEPVTQALKSISIWAAFCVLGTPDINQVRYTRLIVAGAVWTLPYEWYYYLCLPLISKLHGARVPAGSLILSAAALFLFFKTSIDKTPAAAFLGGIVAAYACQNLTFCRVARSIWGSGLAATFLAIGYGCSGILPDSALLVALTVFFCLAVSGSTLFGALTIEPARMLGQISYSVYLLHGILLYSVFTFVLGRQSIPSMSALEHWGMIVALVPVLVLACYVTYRLVEEPTLSKANSVAEYLQRRFQKHRASI